MVGLFYPTDKVLLQQVCCCRHQDDNFRFLKLFNHIQHDFCITIKQRILEQVVCFIYNNVIKISFDPFYCFPAMIEVVLQFLANHARCICTLCLPSLLFQQCSSIREQYHPLATCMDIRIERVQNKATLTATARCIYKVDARCPALVIRDSKIALLSISHITTPFVLTLCAFTVP